jgi:hypothetical protein
VRCPKCGGTLEIPPPEPPPRPDPPEDVLRCFNCDAEIGDAGTSGRKAIACPRCGRTVEIDPGEPGADDLLPPPPPKQVPLVDRRSGRVLSAETPGEEPPRKFAKSLDTVFLYPFTGLGGAIFLAFLVPVWAVLRAGVIPFSGLIRILVGGYVAAYMFTVLYETSLGKNRAPGPPGGVDLGELFGYFVRFFGATVVSYAPAIVAGIGLIFSLGSGEPGGPEGVTSENAWLVGLLCLAALFGTLYYPMALMVIGFAESWWAGFNYLFGIRSILRFPGDYLLCSLFFVVTVGVGMLLEIFWVAAASESGFAGNAMALLVATVVEFYLWTVQMRVLGLLYLTNKERLGWFR